MALSTSPDRGADNGTDTGTDNGTYCGSHCGSHPSAPSLQNAYSQFFFIAQQSIVLQGVCVS